MVDKSEKFRWLVRLGFAARGLVYLLIGYLALSHGGGETGPEDAFGWLREVPLGAPLLYVVALGLLGYGLYRLCSLLFDVENHGADGNGIAHRVGHGASGLAHLVLAYTAAQFAQGDGAGSGQAQEAAGTVLSVTFGSLVLGLIGVGFIAAAVMQAKSAATGDFMRYVSRRTPRSIEAVGRTGHAARAVVFAIIGWSLMRGAWFASSAQVKTLGEAVGALAEMGTLYMLVAIGLVLFGVFSLLVARYRIVPDLDKSRLRPTLH